MTEIFLCSDVSNKTGKPFKAKEERRQKGIKTHRIINNKG